MKIRAVLVAVLLSLLGVSTAFAAPLVKNAKLSAIAKTRDRDSKGRFLPNVKPEEVRTRAYLKYQARMASHTPGTAEGDYLAAKTEIQTERSAENRAAKVRSKLVDLGKAWGAKVTIGKKVVVPAANP